MSDIFKTSGYRGSIYFAENVQSFNNYWDARRLNISLTYNFGNKKVKRNNCEVNFEEKNRTQ
ncbi:MAG: hypothetical protein H7195_08455 [Chryseobacterium sp.]|nr:hypothetical protein [Chryseobacterium sp.]